MKEAGGGGDGVCGGLMGIAPLIGVFWDCYVLETAPIPRINCGGVHRR